MIEEDLRQELTLHLWEELALRESEGWELFFRRSLEFARARFARRYLERNGYCPGRHVILFFADLAKSLDPSGHSEGAALDAPALAEPRDPFTAADLAELRSTSSNCRRASGLPWSCASGSAPASTRLPPHLV